MSFPTYAHYKDSGVEWLGEVPAHWEVLRLANLFQQMAEEGADDLPILSVSIHSGVSDKEMNEEEMDRKVTRSDDRSKYKRVMPRDLVYNMMRAWQGGFGAVTIAGMVSPAYVVARPTRIFVTEFVEQQLRTPNAVEEMRRHSQGVTDFRLRLYWEEFKTLQVVLPPIEDQRRIMDELSGETSKIDALITEQRTLIDLLKEKRQAVISHAVTKGLDPRVAMKDSGVEWLGEVPAHWDVTKAGRYLSILPGYAFPSAEFSLDEANTKLLRGINVGVSKIKWDEAVYWTRFDDDGLDAFELADGDIVIGMDRPYISEGMRVAKISEADLPCLLLQRVAAIRASGKLSDDHIFLLLSSNMFLDHFSPETTGVSVPHISPSQIAEFIIPIPPLGEQKNIFKWIEVEKTRIDALTAEAQTTVALLQERRSALISAAVTGKIDVRQAA